MFPSHVDLRMLHLLSKIPSTSNGLCAVFAQDSSSDVFLHLHYLSNACSQKKRTLLLSARRSEMMYRLMAAKFALRMDPKLVRLEEIASLITEGGDELETNIMSVIRESKPEVVILDDVSVWERLGLSSTSVLKIVFDAMNIVSKGLVYVSSSLNNQTFKRLSLYADTSITLELIGGGFGREVTGKLHILSKTCSLENKKTELLYLTGDRSVKCFYPGDASLA